MCRHRLRRAACCRPPRHRNNQSPHNPYPCKRLRERPQTAQRWPHISASAVFCACGEYQHHRGTPPGAERSPYGRLSAALADTQHAAASAVRSGSTFLPALLPSPRTPLHAEVPPGGHGGSACAGAVTGSRSGTGPPALEASPAAAVPSVAAAVARTSGAIARGPQQPGGVVGGAASMTQRDGDAGRASSTAQPCQVWEALAMAEFCVFQYLRSPLGWCKITSISCSPSLVGRCKGPHAHRQTGGKGSLPPHPFVILSLPLLSPLLAVVNVVISTSVTTFPCLGRLWRREVFRLNQHEKFSSLAIGLLP